MSKFKVGDKVRVLPRLEGQYNQSPYYVDDMTDYAGDEFVIREICADTGFIIIDSLWFDWHEDWLEIAKKPFTQQDLEVGMLVEYELGGLYSVDSESSARMRRISSNIVAIYKPTKTGFERVWSKQEPKPKLYTLELPGKAHEYCEFYNKCKEDDSYFFESSTDTDAYKTHFTQEEIENLPNQELIKLLVKNEVVK